jgi:hypothetical protein
MPPGGVKVETRGKVGGRSKRPLKTRCEEEAKIEWKIK